MIKATRQLLDGTKTNSVLSAISPLSDMDRRDIEGALIKYEEECRQCAQLTGNDVECMDIVKENFRRRMPSAIRQIYPWRNYDWDYGTHAENNYSPEALPKPSNSISGMFQGIKNIVKTVDGMMFVGSPDAASSAFGSDRSSDFPVIGCGNDVRCRGKEYMKRMLTQDEVRRMNNPFLKRKLDGEMSSSYFFQIGTCPRDDIVDEKTCRKNGFIWNVDRFDKSGGNCNQPRYAFVDNSAKPFVGGSNAKGQIIAVTSNISEIADIDILGGFLERSSGSLEIMQCPEVKRKEAFTTGPSRLHVSESESTVSKIVSMVVVVGLLSTLLYGIRKHRR